MLIKPKMPTNRLMPLSILVISPASRCTQGPALPFTNRILYLSQSLHASPRSPARQSFRRPVKARRLCVSPEARADRNIRTQGPRSTRKFLRKALVELVGQEIRDEADRGTPVAGDRACDHEF